MLENPHSYRTVIHGEPSFLVSAACGTAGKQGKTKCAAVSVGQSFYQCISMAAKTSDSVVPENRNAGSGRKSSSHSRKGSRKDRKMCCTFSEISTKQLVRFRISFDSLWCVLANSLFLRWDCAWLFQSHIIHLLHWHREVCVPITVLILWVRRCFHCCFYTPCFSV